MKLYKKQTFLFALVILALLTAPTAATIRVALWGDDDSRLADVQTKISNAGSFEAVDVINITTHPLPTLAEARKYDSIMIFGGERPWGQAVSDKAGDILASYADAGGGVVTGTFVLGSNLGSWILGGTFNSDRYHVMVPVVSQADGHQTLGMVHHPDHPIMKGVDSFDGGYSSYRVPITDLTSGSILIAEWSNGLPLVAVKDLPNIGGRRVDLNFYAPSSDERSDFWRVGTDGDVLLANAVTWAVPEPATILMLGLGGFALLGKKRRINNSSGA